MMSLARPLVVRARRQKAFGIVVLSGVAVVLALAATQQGGIARAAWAGGALLAVAGILAILRIRLELDETGVRGVNGVRAFGLAWSEIDQIRTSGAVNVPLLVFEADGRSWEAGASAGLPEQERMALAESVRGYARIHGIPCEVTAEELFARGGSA